MRSLRREENFLDYRWHDLRILLVTFQTHGKNVFLHFLRSFVQKLHSVRLVWLWWSSPLCRLLRFLIFLARLGLLRFLLLWVFFIARCKLAERDLNMGVLLGVYLVWARVKLLDLGFTGDHR